MKKQSIIDFERHYKFWKPWNSMCTEVRHFWESICRFFYWGWKMRLSYDWDYSGIYEMMKLKLDRMIPIFENTEYHHYSKKFLQRMKIVRELARRLREEDYYQYYNAHITKWGRSKLSLEHNTRRCIFINPPTVTVENEDRYNKEYKLAIEEDEKDHQRDKKRFFDMLNHYIERWVD